MLQDHVISVDVAIRLKELGVTHSSLFHWERLTSGEYRLQADEFIGPLAEEWFAAYTVSELGILLPDWCSSSRNHDGTWDAYPSAIYGDMPTIFGEPTEAEARGRLLIAILERNSAYSDSQQVYQ